jgi:hypothetical protein
MEISTGQPMNYPDGKNVMVGDRLRLWEGCHGVVVCSIDDDHYTLEYPKAHWGYLTKGVIINSSQGGLIHYTEPEESFELIERNARIKEAQ